MEMLHALRFWTKLHRMDPAITPEGWSEIYAQLQAHPHWRCGCPNQRAGPAMGAAAGMAPQANGGPGGGPTAGNVTAGRGIYQEPRWAACR